MTNRTFFYRKEEYVCQDRRYLDISSKLHYFLRTKTIGVRLCFSSRSVESGTLLAVYYKDSFLPDFSLGLFNGLVQLLSRKDGKNIAAYSRHSFCDGAYHSLLLNGDGDSVKVWVDGELEICLDQMISYCEYGYVGFATLGRGCSQFCFSGYLEGRMKEIELSEEPFPKPPPRLGGGPKEGRVVFGSGMGGYENFRIPSLVATEKGSLIAVADGRKECPGDNPNHIAKVLRKSTDNGKSWSPLRTICDFGGEGREEGAAAVDGCLLYDREVKRLILIYSHTPAGVGSISSQAGTGMDGRGRLILTGKLGERYLAKLPGAVEGMEEITVDVYRRLYRDGRAIGSACFGEDSPLREANTSFIQMIYSDDDGDSWSSPVDLNSQVKEPWMCFIGPGPGCGIQLTEGEKAGRLVAPIYYSNSRGFYSCGVMFSDDHGMSWRAGASVNDNRFLKGGFLSAEKGSDPEGFLGEAQVTELPKGHIKIFIRNGYYGRIATSVSEDGGETWRTAGRELECSQGLPDCDCQCFVLRTGPQESPVYLFSNPSAPRRRAGGRIRISRDAGESWSQGLLVESGEFAYSAMAELPDGSLGILYEGRDVELLFQRIPIERLEVNEKEIKG